MFVLSKEGETLFRKREAVFYDHPSMNCLDEKNVMVYSVAEFITVLNKQLLLFVSIPKTMIQNLSMLFSSSKQNLIFFRFCFDCKNTFFPLPHPER